MPCCNFTYPTHPSFVNLIWLRRLISNSCISGCGMTNLSSICPCLKLWWAGGASTTDVERCIAGSLTVEDSLSFLDSFINILLFGVSLAPGHFNQSVRLSSFITCLYQIIRIAWIPWPPSIRKWRKPFFKKDWRLFTSCIIIICFDVRSGLHLIILLLNFSLTFLFLAQHLLRQVQLSYPRLFHPTLNRRLLLWRSKDHWIILVLSWWDSSCQTRTQARHRWFLCRMLLFHRRNLTLFFYLLLLFLKLKFGDRIDCI